MKSLKITTFSLLILLVLSVIISPGNANPIIIPFVDLYLRGEIALTYFMLILITLAVECITFFIFTKRNILNRVDLFKFVVLINLITFPITQFLGFLFMMSGYFSGPPFYFYYFVFYLFIELLPILLEFSLFRKIFDEYNKDLQILNPISGTKIFIYTLTANISTFIIGHLLILSTNLHTILEFFIINLKYYI